ncbi:MAG: sigma-70 family RNA polymerase sigma factor [Actinomycetota bacterium]
MPAAARSDAQLVIDARDGDSGAFGELFERWFDRVYDVARNVVRNDDTAADVSQDVFIAAWERLGRLDNPEAFGGWILRISRNRALDRLRKDGRARPEGDDVVTGMHDAGSPDAVLGRADARAAGADPGEAVGAVERDELVGAAAVALGERDASLLDLHLRHGLTPAEIADEMGIEPNTAHQQLFRMRDRLGNAIGALLLWHRGNPQCTRLAAVLPDGGRFDAKLLRTIERHRKQCDECSNRRKAMVAPHTLFSAMPIAAVPMLLRSRVADGLRAAGIDVGDLVNGGASGESGTESTVESGADGITDPANAVEPGIVEQPAPGSSVPGQALAEPTTEFTTTSLPAPGEHAPAQSAPEADSDGRDDGDGGNNDGDGRVGGDGGADGNDAIPFLRRRRGALLTAAAAITVLLGIGGLILLAGGDTAPTEGVLAAIEIDNSGSDVADDTDEAALVADTTTTTTPPTSVNGSTTSTSSTTSPTTTLPPTTVAEIEIEVAVAPAEPPAAAPPAADPPSVQQPAPPARPPAATSPPVAQPPNALIPATTTPPPPPPPASTTTTTTTTTTLPPPPPPPPPAPTIERFSQAAAPTGCWRVVWSVSNADSGSLVINGASEPASVPSGSRTSCDVLRASVALRVAGPGGATEATITVSASSSGGLGNFTD